MSISVQNLSKHYGSQKAVNNISFTLGKGEIVGFLGPNGAGKSTTMKMITGYLQADEGEIMVCDIQVKDGDINSRQKIGYLPEANPLYHEMYVREYLQFIAGIHDMQSVKKNIEEVIETVGLKTEAHKKIGQLSKGYKQRVGLAAALIHNPEVLILDEPTNGLDPNQIIEIRSVIKKLAEHKTVLFSSHIMQEVEALCDRVIIINKGEIVADERLENLRRNETKDQVVNVEFKQAPVLSELENITGVTLVKEISINSFQLICTNAEMVKKEILSLSINHNLDIVSLQTQQRNLESIFKQLTT